MQKSCQLGKLQVLVRGKGRVAVPSRIAAFVHIMDGRFACVERLLQHRVQGRPRRIGYAVDGPHALGERATWLERVWNVPQLEWLSAVRRCKRCVVRWVSVLRRYNEIP